MAVSMIPNTKIQITDETAYMELFVDSADELTGLDSFGGSDLVQGCPALDIATGDIYAIDSTGEWKNQTGETSTRAAVQDTRKISIDELKDEPEDEVDEDAERDTDSEDKTER